MPHEDAEMTAAELQPTTADPYCLIARHLAGLRAEVAAGIADGFADSPPPVKPVLVDLRTA